MVINIPDEIYSSIKGGFYDENVRKMAIAIGNGTPLPNGFLQEIDDAHTQGYKDALEGKYKGIMKEKLEADRSEADGRH